MKYGYARVSTLTQKKDGNSLEIQEKLLKSAGADVVLCDSFTGTKKNRPKFDEIMKVIKAGDTLIVTKLDRMARSTIHGTSIIEELLKRDVTVHILNMGILDNTPASKLMRTMFFAFAEFERDMIVERTQEGKAYAKANNPNYKEGRPSFDVALVKKEMKFVKKGEKTVSSACEELGITRTSWYRIVKRIELEQA